MAKPIWIKSTLIFCADLETCTPNTIFYQKHNDTFVYAFKLVRVPIQWHPSQKEKGVNEWIPLSFTGWNKHPQLANICFANIEQFINWVKTKLHPYPTTTTYIYFHNGQKFDFWFFLKPLIELGFKLVLDDLQKKNWKKGTNYFVFGDSEGWLSLKVYVWITNYWAKIEFRDSIKLQNSSILSISKNLFGANGVYANDVKANPWFKNLDLTKHTEFNPDDVQNKKGNAIMLSDGTWYDYTNVNAWPDTIKKRVESDVYIMVAMLYYYLLNHVINLPGDDRIPQTTGSLAIMTYVNLYLKQKPELKISMGKDRKHANKILWDDVYNCSNEYRVGVRNILLGNDYLPSIVRGGYCNVLDSCKNQLIKGEFISLDVNSEYPFVACQDLPYGEHESVNHIPTNKWYICWYYVKEMKQLVNNAPAMLPAKWQDNENKAVHYLRGVKDCYIVMTKEEREEVFMNADWFAIKGAQLVQCFAWNQKPYVKNYMLTNYKAKLEASKINNASLKQSAKLKLNALTGKFIQNFIKPVRFYPQFCSLKMILDYIQKNMNDELSEETINEVSNAYQTDTKIICNLITPNAFAYAPVYCAITGKGRAWIQQHILTLASQFKSIKVMYSDTDSIKIWTKNKSDYNKVMKYVQGWLDNDELGKFKEEFKGTIKEANFLCPKKYLCADDNGIINISKCALSGLGWHDVFNQLKTDQVKITDVKIGDKFTVLRPKKVEHGIVLINSEYILKNDV